MHVIQRQTVDIMVRDRADADFWQNRMSMINDEFFIEKLDDILSSHFIEIEKTSIDKLVIDLGTISKDHSPESLAKRYEAALIHAISDYKKLDQNESQNTVYAALSNNGIDIIVHYLKYGYLKWNITNRTTFQEKVRELILNFPEPFFRIIILESQNKNIWCRLIQLIEKDTWDKIMDLVFKSKYWTFNNLFEKFRLILAQSSIQYLRKLSLYSVKEYLKFSLIQYYADLSTKGTEPTSWYYALAYVWHSFIKLTSASKSDMKLEDITTAFTEVFQLSDQDQKIWSAVLRSGLEHELVRNTNKTKVSSEPRRSEDLALYCDHTGAVILWPFLSGFFSSFEWTDKEGNFIDHFMDKAIISIYYMCTGTFPENETELPVMKIMCGINLEDSVDLSVLPSKDEQNKLDELLQNVTRNWSILKTDKVEAIRKPFLQRYGAVKLSEHGWLVIPEKNGIDILLQRLPWPISTIKFPWNDYLIQVDWA